MSELILPTSVTGKVYQCWCGVRQPSLEQFERHAKACFKRNRDYLQDVAERIQEDPFIGQGNEEAREAQKFIWDLEHGVIERPRFGRGR